MGELRRDRSLPTAAIVRKACKIAAALLLTSLAVAILLLAVLDATPLVSRTETISPASIAHARRLLAAQDPRRLQRGDERRVVIPASLIDDAVNHIAGRRWRGRAAFVMARDSAELRFTVRAPGIPGPRYFNLRASFRAADGEPRISAAALGKLPLPASLLEFTLAAATRAAGYGSEWALARSAIRGLVFEPTSGTLAVTYVWHPEILDRARSLAVAAADVPRLKAAQTDLAALLDHRAPWRPVPLPAVLKPMLAATGDEPRARRRAALLVLASYMAGKSLVALVPEAGQWPQPRPLPLTLHERHDSAQHFVISAALAAWAGEPVADAIGLYKEIDDSRRGSGFSFADLAADRAGTRFGELLGENPQRLDAVLRGNLSDADLVPSLDGLPEHLSEREFRRRYGATDTAAYKQVAAEIEARIAVGPLYR